MLLDELSPRALPAASGIEREADLAEDRHDGSAADPMAKMARS